MKFIADVHLGKLAKLLRMLGFDTLYNNSLTNSELKSVALEQGRMLLSRNASINNYKTQLQSFYISYEHPELQLQQVMQHFNLTKQIHPFTRCIICNGILQPIAKEDILLQLPQNTIQYFNEFWQCNNCKRIYWKGSHYEHMSQLIEKIMRQQ
jgi:uncharacterized protein with PIN domain